MGYAYCGYLKGLLDEPDASEREGLDHVEFTCEDIEQWAVSDADEEREWLHVSAHVQRDAETESVLLTGSFEDVRSIDDLAVDDPRYWAPLTSIGVADVRFPVDVSRFPIVELTYRCPSSKGIPAWLWRYPGGERLDWLTSTKEWNTVVRCIPHFGFPSQVDGLTFRLYSTSRSTETLEIRAVRFRAMSRAEAGVLVREGGVHRDYGAPRHYPLLDDFLPLGVHMKANSAKHLAEMMEISFKDYFRLAFDDIARHHHNSVALEEMSQLSRTEWNEVLDLAEHFGLRILAMHDWPLDEVRERGHELVAEHVAPYVDSPALLGWSISSSPGEHHIDALLHMRGLIEQSDVHHPMTLQMKGPGSYPLLAPFFSAGGISHAKSHAPWSLGKVVNGHARLNLGQHFWATAAAFTDVTETPAWSTCPEMRLSMNLAFAHGARGWFVTSYHNDPIWVWGHCQRSLTGPFLTFSDLWSELGHRVERFSAMAPIILDSDYAKSPEHAVRVTWETHPRSKLPRDVSAIEWHTFQGADYELLYVVSNDTIEVTPVNIEVPKQTANDLELFDITDFVRVRSWTPMEHYRHIEMFPGQGQIMLIASQEVCGRWRDRISEVLVAGDRRQLTLDMDIAARYGLNLSEVERLLGDSAGSKPQNRILDTLAARDQLVDMLYETSTFAEPRSILVRVSAGICGCDGTLCRLIGMGKGGQARILGRKVLPLTQELISLRLQLLSGQGAKLRNRCVKLVENTHTLLMEIRGLV